MAKRIHFVGIGGAGMSAIARVLLSEGKQVSGSDLQESTIIDELRRHGAQVWIGHSPQHVIGADEVILSTAITDDNPEALEAKRRGIPVRHRSEALADLLNQKKGVAIAGAHGKTTVTSMISWTLDRLGESITFLIGGILPGVGGAKAGLGPILIAEADESDGSFLRYRPYLAVVTSVEADHLENYNNSSATLQQSYRRFLEHVKPGGIRVLCADDDTLRSWAQDYETTGRVLTYGLRPEAQYSAIQLEARGFKTTFRLVKGGALGPEFELAVPGHHNVQNALACIAVCEALGADLDGVRRELATFKGARRRFEVVDQVEDRLIVDDYAHHPSEIRATLNAARTGWPGRRIVAVFQPHRYSRTSQLMDEFATSFGDADVVVLTEIYAPAPEQPIPGVSGERLAQLTRRALNGMKHEVHFAPGLCDAVDVLRETVVPGDIVITMGAGDVWKVGRAFAGRSMDRF